MAVKFFSTTCDESNISITPGLNIKQFTKLNIVASPEQPHETVVDIKFDNTFKRLPLEVLRADGYVENEVETLASFDNSDNTDFESNKHIVFDGKMHLKTNYIESMEDRINYMSWDTTELKELKKLKKFEVR